MYIAAQNGQVGTLKALISAGANVNTAEVVSIYRMCQFFVHNYCLYYTTFGIQIRDKVQK